MNSDWPVAKSVSETNAAGSLRSRSGVVISCSNAGAMVVES